MVEPDGGRLILARACLRVIREHAEAAWPLEACGLLEGWSLGRSLHVRRIIPCRNEHERPAGCYRIAPEAFLRADRRAADGGRAIVGAWHSHPNGEAYFSERDRTEAWRGWGYLVAGVHQGRLRQLGGWLAGDDGFSALRITVGD